MSVSGALVGDEQPDTFLEKLCTRAGEYAGFNLLVADRRSAAYLSNRGGGMRELPPGIYGLSNATLDDPWTKVTRSKSRLAELIAADGVSAAGLLQILADRQKASAGEVHANGLSFAMAHALSAPFIVHPEYGTRCSTVVTIDADGRVRFVERRFEPDGRNSGESRYSFESGGQHAR